MPGISTAQHIFKGLRRPLFNDNSKDGDKEKLIYTWRSDLDFEWERDPKNPKFGNCRRREAPQGFVFAVIVSPNIRSKGKFPGIDCFIEAWAWLREDPGLRGAPVEWVDRYEQRIWTRSD